MGWVDRHFEVLPSDLTTVSGLDELSRPDSGEKTAVEGLLGRIFRPLERKQLHKIEIEILPSCFPLAHSLWLKILL